jgi:Tfp pilus assembly protein FimV
MTSDAELPTRLGAASESELRQRYIEERFPEIATGMIELSKPDSVIKAARLFYEDGAVPRAVELLQFALEAHPDQMRYWLALFEIYRLERLSGEFGALALRFHQQFAESEAWRKVQYFGREIDPANELYKEPPVNSLETIGPRESRRLAAGASFDPAAENWLNAPMDFENEVLANELRQGLMQKAGLAEEDLAPNPMPALRHIEMFTVA